jgi:isoleucyl-tRNA synthetase
MYHILEAMVRWIAPILSFTAEELWGFMPGERNESVLLNTWYEGLQAQESNAAISNADWAAIFKTRETVAKALENLRNEGKIKGGLTAELSLTAGSQLYSVLDKLGDELKFVLIVSKVELSEDSAAAADALSIDIQPATAARCERCWHQVESVGQHATHPELCGRCADNIEGAGEQRLFA